ncbi:hypothetical protein, partial [Slackia sp. CM382]|uniref:hypothetical protein n=1 Tax=Slackia sp. CM382 TaxID=1111137 RepID=UPI001EE2F7FA
MCESPARPKRAGATARCEEAKRRAAHDGRRRASPLRAAVGSTREEPASSGSRASRTAAGKGA